MQVMSKEASIGVTDVISRPSSPQFLTAVGRGVRPTYPFLGESKKFSSKNT